jgi:4a-hydroxytetrahydrobiopterin dehydratase
MINGLAQKKCVPCEGGVKPLKGETVKKLLSQLETGWKVVHEDHLEREFKFKNFKDALSFVNKVGAIAEKEQHHPNIELTWGYVKIRLWTHAIGGLSDNDFILAAKIDELL